MVEVKEQGNKKKRFSSNKTSRLLRKINLRTLLKSKFQFLAVILITAISMMLFIGLTSNAASIESRVDTLYKGSNMADIFTTTTMVQEGDLDAINASLGEGGSSEERLSLNGKIMNFYGNALVSDELPTICKPAETDNTDTENFFIIDKRLVEEKRNDFVSNGYYKEIPLSISFTNYQTLLQETKLKDMLPEGIGSLISSDVTMMDVLDLCVKPGKTNIFNAPFLEMNFQITGQMLFAENVQTSTLNNTSYLLNRGLLKREFKKVFEENFAKPALEISNPDYLIQLLLVLGGFDALDENITMIFDMNNQIVSKVGNRPINDAITDISNYYSEKADKGQINNLVMLADIDHLPSNITIQNDIVQAQQLAYVFPLIFFLIAILVVLTTISQIIVKERTTIGTFKALGLSKGRIIWHYISLSLIIVTFGAIIGTIFGPMILEFIMNQKYTMLYTLPRLVLMTSFPHLILALFLLYSMTILVTYLICRKEASLKPALSMRPKVVKGFKAKHKDAVTKNPLLISFKMAFRNIRLNIPKSLMVILGICGCTSLLVCGFGINDTINYGIEKDMTYFYGADVSVSYDSISSLEDELMSIEGVEKVDEYANLPTTINFTNPRSTEILETTYQSLAFLVNEESQIFADQGVYIGEKIAVSSKVAKALDLQIDDTIEYSVIGKTFTAQIGAIVETFYVHALFINVDKLNDAAVSNMKNKAWVTVKDGYNHDEIADQIKEINGIIGAQSAEASRAKNNEYMSGVYMMTTAIIVFALSLAVVVLYNLVLLNYKERIRDIATLKVLGFSRREIGNSLILETMVLCLIGIAIGLCLGLPMEMLVLTINTTPLIEFLWFISPLTYVISFLVTFGTGLLVNLFLTRKIKTIPMVESLKSVD